MKLTYTNLQTIQSCSFLKFKIGYYNIRLAEKWRIIIMDK